MANLLVNHSPNAPLLQPQALPRRPPHQPLDVVEISDDSEPSPSSRLNRQPPSLNLRRPALPDFDSDQDEDEYFGFDSGSDSGDSLPLYQQALDPDRRHKRPKLRHSPPSRFIDRPDVKIPAWTPAEQPPNKTARFTAPGSHSDRSFGRPSDDRPRSSFQSLNATVAPDNTFDAPQPAPYYFDTLLDAEMYRGPGFERFPVVLGTVEGHREACEKWKAKNALPSLRTNLTDEGAKKPDEDEDNCLQRVLEVFPDIQTGFVLQKIRDLATQVYVGDDEIDENILPTRIISQILEMGQYPKGAPTATANSKKSALVDETGITVTWDKNLPKNTPYLKDAVILLAGFFDHVPTHYIYKVVHEKRAIFQSYVHLQEAESNYYAKANRPYTRSRQPRKNLEKKYSRGQYEQRDRQQYAQMVNELQAARQHVAGEALKLSKQKEKDEAEAANLALYKASGSLVECKCCFDEEIPLNRSVGCEAEGDIHFFCFSCVARLAETQVGMMKYEMLCMDGSGCKASLSVEGVGQAVPIKTFDKLSLNQQQAEIAAAGIDGLEQCPFCDFKAICEPIEQMGVFNCQNPDCRRATCRRCNEDAHGPKSCEESKADRGLSARHRIEEARTESVLRRCPNCDVKIIKELGCNKMRCTTCGCIMCYVCKVDISKGGEGGYAHFNKPGAKCSLYDERGIDRHEVEADEAEKEAIKKVKAEHADLDEKQLHIETGSGQKKPRTVPQPQLARLPRDMYAARLHQGENVNDRAPQHFHPYQAQMEVLQRGHAAEPQGMVNEALQRFEVQAAALHPPAPPLVRVDPPPVVQQQHQLSTTGPRRLANEGDHLAHTAANQAFVNAGIPHPAVRPQWVYGYPNHHIQVNYGLDQYQAPPMQAAAGLDEGLDEFLAFNFPPVYLNGVDDLLLGFGNDDLVFEGFGQHQYQNQQMQ